MPRPQNIRPSNLGLARHAEGGLIARRVLEALGATVFLTGILGRLLSLGPLHAIAMASFLFLAFLTAMAILFGPHPAGRRWWLALPLVVCVSAAAWTADYAERSPASHPSAKGGVALHRQSTDPQRKHKAAIATATTMSVVARRPSALTVNADAFWTAGSSSLTRVGRRETPRVIHLDAQPFDLAASRTRVVVVEGGDVVVFGSASGNEIGSPIPFGDVPGRVAVGSGAAWLCNRTYWKLDRLDLRTRQVAPIQMPGVPNDVLLAHGSAWVSLRGGEIEKVDRRTNLPESTFHTSADPQSMAYGFHSLWVSHPALRTVTRMDPKSGEQIGPPIQVMAGTRALVAEGNYVWALSTPLDSVQRIDPRLGKVAGYLGVAEAPTDLVKQSGDLYFVSATHASLVRLEPSRKGIASDFGWP